MGQRGLGRFGPGARVLRNVAERATAQHETCRGIVLAGQDLEQARLAGAVTANQSHLVARGDCEVGVRQNAASRDVYSEITDLEHAGNCYLRGRPAFGQSSNRQEAVK